MRTALWLVLVVITVGAANHLAFALDWAGSLKFWLTVGMPTALLAAVSAWQMHRRNQLRALLRPAAGDVAIGLASMLALFGAAYVASKFLMPAGAGAVSWTPGNYVARVYVQLGAPLVVHDNTLPIIGALILMALAEELVWRGFVTALLDEKFGARVGWLYATALYVLAYLPSMWSLRDPITGPNPALPLAALGGGLVWGALVRRYRRLVPGVISHALFLWFTVIVFRLWGPNV